MSGSRNLYNTRLLLRNYTRFKQHVDSATFSSSDIEELEEEFVGLGMEDKKDTYINSILRTKERTRIMIAHIDNLLDVYKKEAKENEDQEQLDRCKIIHHRYIVKNKKSIIELSMDLCMSQATVYRYEEKAIKELSVLFFGVDAISIVIKQ